MLLPVVAAVAVMLMAIAIDLSSLQMANRRAQSLADGLANDIASEVSASTLAGGIAAIDPTRASVIENRRRSLVASEPWLQQSNISSSLSGSSVVVTVSAQPPIVFRSLIPRAMHQINVSGESRLSQE